MHTIRKVRVKDINELSILVEKTIKSLSYYNAQAVENEVYKYSFDKLTEKHNADSNSILIAEEDNKIIGFCFWREDDFVAWLEWIGVTSDNRKRGIAKALLKFLEEIIREKGFNKIWCDSRTSNKASISLFASADYLPLCTIKKHWYGHDYILWHKELL